MKAQDAPKTLQSIIDETLASVDLPKEKAAAPMFVFAGSNNQINASLQGHIYVNQARTGDKGEVA